MQSPFPTSLHAPWQQHGRWPCAWVALPDAPPPPFVAAYRLRFSLEAPASIRAHVSADERYELFLDGQRIGRGSERGAPDLWFYESYTLDLDAGSHVLVARVWSLGERAPVAQMSVCHGFLFAPEGAFAASLATGNAAWEARTMPGYRFLDPSPAKWRGDTVEVDGAAFPWGFERGEGDGWRPAARVEDALDRRSDWEFPPQHLLHPATLPPMLSRELRSGAVRVVAQAPVSDARAEPVRLQDHLATEGGWNDLLAARGSVIIPPHTARRVLVDLENYYCAYPELVTSGGAGASVRLHWAEALRHTPNPWDHDKGNRDEIDGKYFVGFGDTFLPDGAVGRRFEPLWWSAGRYVELLVRTADEPLTIERLALHETRYPLKLESTFAASDGRLERLIPLLVRGMQMCAHETFMDCPYYEELQYAGDARLEMLIGYVMTRDDKLARKALRLFDASRLASGLTQSRYPSRGLQIIAPFALWWVAMVRDYALWRDDEPFVRALLPGVRATLQAFRRYTRPDGLLGPPEGWNTIDWVPEWDAGNPPDATTGASGVLNWQLVYVLTLAAELEEMLGAGEQAAYNRRWARELAQNATDAFWDEGRGLLADDLTRQHFSEHAQCLALLSGLLEEDKRARVADGLLRDEGLSRATIYFSHYLFEAYRLIGRPDALLDRMGLWFDLVRQGFRTPVESPEPSRSDCHAWGSHPLFHYFATLLGIRPVSLGFRSIQITPQLGTLTSVMGRLVHPAGVIEVDLRMENGAWRGAITLPDGVSGTLHIGEHELPLTPGTQQVA